jgi:peptide/nickel transport system substrate-binding protein
MSNSSDAPDDTNPTIPVSKPVSRRKFLKYVAAGVVVAAAGGMGGYYYLTTQRNNGHTTTTLIIDYNNEISLYNPANENYPDDSYLTAIYSHWIEQNPDLSYAPGLVSNWQWNSDKTELDLTLNKNVKFHDGSQFTAADLVFSLQNMQANGNNYAGVFSAFGNPNVIDDYHVNLPMTRFDPSMAVWIGFLGSYIIPKDAFNKASSANAFFSNPVGSGPYKFVSLSGNVLKLTAFDEYYQGRPVIDNIVFNSVIDPVTRAADVESGGANFTEAVNASDYNRLSTTPGLVGKTGPVSLVFQLFYVPYFELWKNEDLRLALHYAIDKQSIVKNVLLGFGIPLSTVAAPQYKSYPANYTFPYDPNKATQILSSYGYTPSNPLKIDVNAFQGVQSSDFQVMQAVAQMWAQVGVQANLIPMTQEQFFSLRDGLKLGALTTDVWTDPTGDPINNVGYEFKPDGAFAVLPSVQIREQQNMVDYTGYYGQDGKGLLTSVIEPVFNTVDDNARIQAGQQACIYASEHGLVIPLYQAYEPYIWQSKFNYTPYASGWLRPNAFSLTSTT